MAEIGTKKDPNPNLEKEEQPNTPSDLLSPSPVKDPFQSPPPPKKKQPTEEEERVVGWSAQRYLVCLCFVNTQILAKVPSFMLFKTLNHYHQSITKKEKSKKHPLGNPCECKKTKHTQQQK